MLGIPWMVLHTAADNCATTYLQKRIEAAQPETLQDVLNFLLSIPEYEQGARELIGPRLVIGKSPKSKAGKVVVDMTGGAEAPTGIFPSFADSGIKTILCMHVSEGWYEEAARHHVQIVCAGHSPSDTLGMNLLLDETMPEGVEMIPNEKYPKVGAFRRFSHRGENWNGEA